MSEPRFIVALSELCRYEVYAALQIDGAEIWCRLSKGGTPTKDTVCKFWLYTRAVPRGLHGTKRGALEHRDRLNAAIPSRGIDGRGCPI